MLKKHSNVEATLGGMDIDEVDENGFAIIRYDKNKSKVGDVVIVRFSTKK